MCVDPATLMVASLAVSTAAAGFQAVNAVQQGGFQAALAERQARQGREMADDARARGVEEAQDKRLEVSRFRSRQAAQIAENGGDPTFGSSAGILRDTEVLGERDAFRITRNAGREALGYERGAAATAAQGQNARTQGLYNAAGTVLTTAGQVSSRWAEWQS